MSRNLNKRRPWSALTEDERRIVLAAMGLDRKGPQARESRDLERKLAESNAEYERVRVGGNAQVGTIKICGVGIEICKWCCKPFINCDCSSGKAEK